MPQKSHLPGHLDSLRTKTRPRHQLLVLKCYPRLPKNATADVRPNSSELSYLIYYCSSRQEKLPKVGIYLQKSIATDVHRWQSARVHVTLQILTAFLEHKEIGGRASGFTLFAPYVLRIIREIINNTNDISLVEATTSTWDAFCQHQDVGSLAADAEYRALYEEIVRLYADLARNSSKKLGGSTQLVAHHDATRLRKAGVAAIKSIFVPTELDRQWNRAFDSTFAAVLSNLHRDLQANEEPQDYVEHLIALNAKNEQEEEQVSAVNRRQSIATVRTFSGLADEQDPDPRAAEGTAQDADRLAEEEVGLLALDCIKTVFSSQNRAQARGGAEAFMRYVAEKEQRYIATNKPVTIEPWAAELFRLIISWTPVQDRFIFIVTAVEFLVRFPMESSQSFRVAAVYAKSILDVLRSDLNLIGLSVIDILLGLIHMTVRTIAIARAKTTDAPINRITTAASKTGAAEELIPYFKACIANLARHVYYSDQVTDLISFILLRVKPDAETTATEPSSERERPATMTAATNPKVSASDVASAAGRPHTQGTPTSSTGTFATEDGRQIALEIIKDIIDIAKSTQQYSTGSVVITRNRVPLGVWEGSQWLLRDPSHDVRRAYKTALLEWVRFESDEGDEALIDFEADDCIEKLAEKKKPAASLHGSIGQSHRSAHPQLLMLPTNGAAGERRMSSGKNSSNGTEPDATKPRVRASDLKEIIDGKRFVAPVKSGGGEEQPLDVKALLATIKIDPSRNQGLSMAPPY
ncbi:Hypothetical predicted protein [Lecanosticta acicola]|uniref:Protein EFR3 n=1 Tax=Lecanosticta acicola TaxID=111012 RepID=A0AAI8Z9I1_9PEZI|nr:Hypothetical predicted protein [Lecanosticta acicola]